MGKKIHVIGVGYKPLTEAAVTVIKRAPSVLVSRRLHEVFCRDPLYESVKNRVVEINGISETMEFLVKEFESGSECGPVLIASGDPLFSGIGKRVVELFGAENTEIEPELSSLQVAFARTGEHWDDAFLISLHGGAAPIRRKQKYRPKDVPGLVLKYRKLGILTDPKNNPRAIAEEITGSASGGPEVLMHVCERLGYEDERIRTLSPQEAAQTEFLEPNVVIVRLKDPEESVGSRAADNTLAADFLGLRENDFEHEAGLITKDEVRAVALHMLKLPRDGVFWDIGSGSGSVSVEAARLCPGSSVFAIEKNSSRVRDIGVNVRRFGLRNVEIIEAPAPKGLSGLPAPSRVFVGGSGGLLGQITRHVDRVMRSGIIVVAAVTLETLNESAGLLEDAGFSVTISSVSATRLKPLGGSRMFFALNPVFLVRGERAEKGRQDVR